MKQLADGLERIFVRRDSRYVLLVTTILFFLLLLLVQSGSTALMVLSFESAPFLKRIILAVTTFFDIPNTFSVGTFIISLLGSFLGGINMSLAYTYARERGEIILRSGLYSGIGLFFAFIGIGCAACGTALITVILSFFGLSAMLQLLPYQGQELGYIGIIILSMTTYALARRVSMPGTC